MQQESIQAAMALVLGPETGYHVRVRAARKIAKRGPLVLPFVLKTLSHYPEITTPTWPWWPPQYEQTSRLLLHLSQQAHLSLHDLLHHTALKHPPGPVLWTSVMEAAGLIAHMDYEDLLCQGLDTPWPSVRYAAAMALSSRAKTYPLQAHTLAALHTHLAIHEAFPVRLTVAYTLFRCGDCTGLETLTGFLLPHIPSEVRKAAIFVLASELPGSFTITRRAHLNRLLLKLLHDPDLEIAQQGAHALSKSAGPAILTELYAQLEHVTLRTKMTILITLEEMAQRRNLRDHMRRHALPTRLLPLVKSHDPDLRRQACYTLVACGGEYVAAVLGTIVMNQEGSGRGEVLESLRFLRGALRAPLRGNIIRWLLQALPTTDEEIRVTALDTLTHLLWQAYNHGKKRAWQEIRGEIIRDATVLRFLYAPNPTLRQRALELLPALGNFLNTTIELHYPVQYILFTDSDSGVRACAAYICGKTHARWAIPSLLRAMLDPNEHVADTAFHALTQIATPNDTMIIYALKELAHLQDEQNTSMHKLAHAASMQLKKWHKAQQDKRH